MEQRIRFENEYVENGKFKYPFEKYISQVNLSQSLIQNQQVKNAHTLLTDMFCPSSYPKIKLTYEYYKAMAMFEKAQSERFSIAYEQGVEKEDEYEETENELQKSQFMWLRQQLSWLGFDDAKYNPRCPAFWITNQWGQTCQVKQALLTFMASFDFELEYTLSIKEEETLKQHQIKSVEKTMCGKQRYWWVIREI